MGRKKKRKKHKDLKKAQINKIDANTTVIDDSELIQNILEQSIDSSMTINNMNNIDQLNIDDIIDEHFEKEQKENILKQQKQQLLQTPIIDRNDIQSQSNPNSPKITPSKPIWRQFRSWSFDENSSKTRKKNRFYPKPNSFIKGISATN